MLGGNHENVSPAPGVESDGKERLHEIEIFVFLAAGPQKIVAELLNDDHWEEVARNDLE